MRSSSLFTGIPTANSADTVLAAATAIHKCKESLAIGDGYWSLAELGATDEDAAWLDEWAACLNRKALSLLGEDATRADFGLVLLLCCAEIGRREADQGILWPRVYHRMDGSPRFSLAAQKRLWFGHQPHEEMKDAFKAATRAYRLRSVFDLEHKQWYRDAVFLQIGLTRQAIEERLPDYLAGYSVPDAVQMLLGGDPARRSRAFTAFWQTLCDYRRNLLSDNDCERHLEKSDWILPGWIGDLLTNARHKLFLSTKTDFRPRVRDISPKDAASVDGEGNLRAEPLLNALRLYWSPPDAPRFAVRFADLSALDLDNEHYELRLGDRAAASLSRQSEGRYQTIPREQPDESLTLPSDAILLPANAFAPEVIASLVADDGATAWTQTLPLFRSNEEVTVFRMTNGELVSDVSTNPLNPAESYALLLAPGLTLAPATETTRWKYHRTRHGTFYRIPPHWPADLEARLDEAVFWKPISAPRSVAEPAWATALTVRFAAVTEFNEADRAALTVEGTHGIEILALRVSGQTLDTVTSDAQRLAGLAELARVGKRVYGRLETAALPAMLHITLIARCGNERAIVRRALSRESLQLQGAFRLGADGWRPFRERETIAALVVERSPVRLFLRPDWSSDDFVYLREDQGECGVRRRHSQPGRQSPPLGRPAGWGGALRLYPKRFNNIPSDAPITLASAVEDRGIVADALFEESDVAENSQYVTLTLTIPFQPDDDTSVHIWDTKGACVRIGSEEIILLDDIGEKWRAGPFTRTSGSRLIAVAVAYEGRRRGAWWANDWANALKDWPARRATAAVLRWLHPPLLHWRAQDAVCTFALRNPNGFLEAWLTGARLPDGLRFTEADGAYIPLRILLADWKSDGEAAAKLLSPLVGDRAKTEKLHVRLTAALERLNFVCPRLAFRFLKAYFEEYYLPIKRRESPAKAATLGLGLLTQIFSGLSGTAFPESLKKEKIQAARKETQKAMKKACAEYETQAAKQLSVDEKYVRGLIDDARKGRSTVSGDLGLCLSLRPDADQFRRAVLFALLYDYYCES